MNKEKNILWINYMKAICIIAVYFVHSTNYYGLYWGNFNRYIETFYVNGFFFISGYLLFRKQLSEPIINWNSKQYLANDGKFLLRNIFYRIIIPSTIFATLEFIPSCIIKSRDISMDLFLYKTIGGGTYWFTSALVVAELMIFILLLTRNKNIIFYIIASSIITIIGIFLSNNNIYILNNFPSFPWCYQNGMLAITFLTLGGAFWKLESFFNKRMNKVRLMIMFIIYIAVIFTLSDKAKVLISLLQLNVLGIITSILSILILVYSIIYFMRTKWSILEFIGKNSIGFYFLSGAFPIILSSIFKNVLNIHSSIGLMCIFVMSLFSAYIFVLLTNRYLPYLYDLRKINIKTKKS